MTVTVLDRNAPVRRSGRTNSQLRRLKGIGMRIPVFLIAVVVALPGCASTPNDGEILAKPRPSYDRNEISREELASHEHSNMWDVVNSLRPYWFRSAFGNSGAGTSISAQPIVFLDGSRFGASDLLKTLSAQSVLRARYLTPTEAQSRYGASVVSPVIEIQSMHRRS